MLILMMNDVQIILFCLILRKKCLRDWSNVDVKLSDLVDYICSRSEKGITLVYDL